jgi:peptidoglycan biosynthesis protein MviN/MurJ (putative lipid II flippase)
VTFQHFLEAVLSILHFWKLFGLIFAKGCVPVGYKRQQFGQSNAQQYSGIFSYFSLFYCSSYTLFLLGLIPVSYLGRPVAPSLLLLRLNLLVLGGWDIG